ncbi:MAG: hypothetical protein AAGK00_19470 [Pseudomonadota bacterium]
MSDQKKPENVADADLDGAQGGSIDIYLHMSNDVQDTRGGKPKRRLPTSGPVVKGMEVVNEDE